MLKSDQHDLETVYFCNNCSIYTLSIARKIILEIKYIKANSKTLFSINNNYQTNQFFLKQFNSYSSEQETILFYQQDPFDFSNLKDHPKIKLYMLLI